MEELRIPGPTPCPREVLQAMSRQMINHRGEEFAGILERLEFLPASKMALIFWADVHIAREESGDLERAEAQLQDAKSAYEEMGAPYFVDIIEKKLEALQAEAED